MTAGSETAESTAATSIRIVSGNPTDEEIAALVAVLAGAAASASGPTEPAIRDDWGRPSSMHRSAESLSPSAFGSGVHSRW